MVVRLDRNAIVAFYVGVAEAERSIHRLLDPFARWLEFQEYYAGKKRESAQRMVELIAQQVALVTEDVSAQKKEPIVRAIQSPGLLRALALRCWARWRSSWSFSLAEARLLVATWRSFLDCLPHADKPPTEFLIGLRKDFYACRFLIESRCVGIPEITQSKPVAHFHQTEWLKSVPRGKADEAA